MKKFIIETIEMLVNIGIAIGVVYLISAITGQHVDEIVGWAALGIAAGASARARK